MGELVLIIGCTIVLFYLIKVITGILSMGPRW